MCSCENAEFDHSFSKIRGFFCLLYLYPWTCMCWKLYLRGKTLFSILILSWEKKNIGGDESLWDEEADGLKLQGSLMA